MMNTSSAFRRNNILTFLGEWIKGSEVYLCLFVKLLNSEDIFWGNRVSVHSFVRILVIFFAFVFTCIYFLRLENHLIVLHLLTESSLCSSQWMRWRLWFSVSVRIYFLSQKRHFCCWWRRKADRRRRYLTSRRWPHMHKHEAPPRRKGKLFKSLIFEFWSIFVCFVLLLIGSISSVVCENRLLFGIHLIFLANLLPPLYFYFSHNFSTCYFSSFFLRETYFRQLFVWM